MRCSGDPTIRGRVRSLPRASRGQLRRLLRHPLVATPGGSTPSRAMYWAASTTPYRSPDHRGVTTFRRPEQSGGRLGVVPRRPRRRGRRVSRLQSADLARPDQGEGARSVGPSTASPCCSSLSSEAWPQAVFASEIRWARPIATALAVAAAAGAVFARRRSSQKDDGVTTAAPPGPPPSRLRRG